MTESEVIERVRGFISENFLYTQPDRVLGEDERLLGSRVLDSMGVMEVIAFIQEAFGVRIAEGDIRESNLGSLRAIARYVVQPRTELRVA